eukprot:TRINITY_DN3074_c0_g1_i2.p2 TRINITY_DN3074_c0_g1~~TRINITY_DN3074_c0_g1_i2.p2  ORF type:complete len:140 (+),score=28.46 TRINITY_DN3074_c0_g1_i2:119-538(+)
MCIRDRYQRRVRGNQAADMRQAVAIHLLVLGVVVIATEWSEVPQEKSESWEETRGAGSGGAASETTRTENLPKLMGARDSSLRSEHGAARGHLKLLEKGDPKGCDCCGTTVEADPKMGCPDCVCSHGQDTTETAARAPT